MHSNLTPARGIDAIPEHEPCAIWFRACASNRQMVRVVMVSGGPTAVPETLRLAPGGRDVHRVRSSEAGTHMTLRFDVEMGDSVDYDIFTDCGVAAGSITSSIEVQYRCTVRSRSDRGVR